ncbi:YlbG family protein [Macrococcus bovicus]|uniref:YlbG family protein n=1 Tax=Macrococcus bovicus TaxID=69968 RepID=UPI0025A63A2A|nr:YlbG family protein [Macrococcus bovicus]WJP98570.1 YlbG family protein [Macrococcus bovicus]
MTLTPRTNLIIYMKSSKNERQLRKYGHIAYFNRRDKWLSLYIDTDRVDEVLEQLSRLKYVLKVEISPYQTLETDYESL